MKVRAPGPGASPDLGPAVSFMESSFSGCVQREKHYNTLQYEIASSSLARIFQLVAANKERLSIEDYSVTQTTLDQVPDHVEVFFFYRSVDEAWILGGATVKAFIDHGLQTAALD